MAAKTTYRDVSPSKYGNRSIWSDISRRYFQQRYLLSWILAVFFPFLVLRLVFFYDGSVSFSSPASTPSTPKTHYIHRRPSYASRHPTIGEKSSITHQLPPFGRPDEDAWTTHDTWINNHQSSIRRKRSKPDTFFPSETEHYFEEDSLEGSVTQSADSFGLPEDNEKYQDSSWKRSQEKDETQAQEDRRADKERQEAAELKKAEIEKKRAADLKEAEEAEKKRAAEEAENKRAEEDAKKKRAAEMQKQEKEAAETKKLDDGRLTEAEAERRIDDLGKADENESREQAVLEVGSGDEQFDNGNQNQETRGDSDNTISEAVQHQDASPSEDLTSPTNGTISKGRCDLFDGTWEYDPEGPLYTNATCFYIQGDQNCMSNGRPDTEYLHWKWTPRGCDLPRFNARAFLESFRGKIIGFVGDSLARNQMQSLLCMLSQVEIPDEIYQSPDDKTVRWLYREHQVTLAGVWSPYLLKESNAGVEGFEKDQSVLYLDVLDPAWTSVLSDFNIIVLSIGQWYFKGSVYVKNNEVIGCHYCPGLNITDVGFYDAYRGAVRQVLEKVASEFKGIVIMSTFAISHFEHGPWEKGGDCRREKPLTQEEVLSFTGMHDEMHDIVMEEYTQVASDETRLKSNPGVALEFLDVTKISLLRADGHPGPYRREHPYAKKDPSEWVPNDCLHWCLPGPVDTWNQLLVKLVQRHIV